MNIPIAVEAHGLPAPHTLLLLLKRPEDAGGVSGTIPRQHKNSLAGSSTARFAGSKLSRSKEDEVGAIGDGVVGYLPTKHGEREHFVCVKEVRQHNGLTVIHIVWETGLGDREIPDIYLWFCCTHTSLNPEVLPPGRYPRGCSKQGKTHPLSDALSAMRNKFQSTAPRGFLDHI